MGIETELQGELRRDDRRQNNQLAKHEKFRERLARGGYVIQKKQYSIPLMERVGLGYLLTK